jgi:hypothetical protein
MTIKIDKNTIDIESIKIRDIFKFYIVDRVKNFKMNDHSFEWYITTDNEESEDIYLILDTTFDNAFGHWVYDSAIYLQVYKELKELYPNLKLLLKKKRDYKLLFCKYFGVNEKDIIYSENEVPKNKFCLFPSPITSLFIKEKIDDREKMLQQYIKCFDKDTEIKNKYLLMPRQSKENYTNNNQKYNFDKIKNDINGSYDILNTDQITDLQKQVDLLQSSETIILTDGSPLLVNGLFVKGKKIIVVGDIVTIKQSEWHYCLKHIIDCIKQRNDLIYCKEWNKNVIM